MPPFLLQKLETNRRAWIWTSVVVFVVLGLVDVDGKGLGKGVDFPPLLVGLIRAPFSFWQDFGREPVLEMLAALAAWLIMLAIIIAMYAFVALILGWVLHFPIALFMESRRRESTTKEAQPESSETDAAR